MAKNSSSVSKRTLLILKLFAEHEELSVSEIASLTDISLSSVYRFVNSLRELDFLEQKSNKNYTLKAPIILRLYGMLNTDLRTFAKPIIKDIVESFKESVYLSELFEEGKVMIIEKEDSPKHLKWVENIGFTYNIPVGTAGRTHLAYKLRDMNDQQQEEYLSKLELIPYTQNSIVDRTELKESLKEIIKDGYCITSGEHVEGIMGISVPVFDYSNQCKHVLTMVMPANTFDFTQQEMCIKALKEGASLIGERITS